MAGETPAPTANGATKTTETRDAANGGHPGAGPVAAAEAITASAADAAVAPAAAAPVVDKHPMGARERGVVGSSLVIATLLLRTQLLSIWPAVIEAVTRTLDDNGNVEKPTMPNTVLLFGFAVTKLHPDVALIEMVMIAGALGALVGGCRRFLYFSTRDELTRRDEWSYLMRPLQGAALALIVYFTLRGGYLGQDQSAPVNPYGIAALSALVGLFTRHAVSKLTDVFDTLFGKPKEDVAPVHVRD